MVLLIVSLFCLRPSFAQELTISGTMHHTMLEGGCWYLQGDGGKKFELTGDSSLVNPLHVDGEHVVIRAEPATGTASICMVGQMVRVLARIDTVRAPYDPAINPMTLDGTIHRTKAGAWYLKTSSGQKYQFRNLPPTKYRHIGMAVHEKFRVLMNQNPTYQIWNGTIISLAEKITKQRIYDSR